MGEVSTQNREEIVACRRCGAPVHPVQRFCLTCGVGSERSGEQLGPEAVQFEPEPEPGAEGATQG
jgi:ribosomal protein L37E